MTTIGFLRYVWTHSDTYLTLFLLYLLTSGLGVELQLLSLVFSPYLEKNHLIIQPIKLLQHRFFLLLSNK